MPYRSIIYSIIVIFVFLSCSEQKPPHEHVQSLSLIESLEYPPNAPDHLWNRVPSMEINLKNEILLMYNIDPYRVDILDLHSLQLIDSWGRTGDGPGELRGGFTWIGSLHDTLIIAQNKIVKRFLLDGTHIDADIQLLDLSNFASMLISNAFGRDTLGNIYKINEYDNDYLFHIINPDGKTINKLVEKNSLDFLHDQWYMYGVAVYGVLDKGDIIFTFTNNPYIARYNSDGFKEWQIDITEELPYMKMLYDIDNGQQRKLIVRITNFYVNERYTILTAGYPHEKEGNPDILYIIIDSSSGTIEKVVYSHNIKPNGEHILFRPTTIAQGLFQS